MSHEIMGDRFISRNKPAWHGLGIMFPENETLVAHEAVERVAGDVDVQTFPLRFDLQGKTYEMHDHVAVVRMPTADSPDPIPFGVVGSRWKHESYVSLARSLDKLSETYRVETAGLLKDGALCFICFYGGEWSVKGDDMVSYFTANLSLKPGVGHRVLHSPVRVVCWNTNTMAIGSANINLSVPHNADAAQQIGLAGNLVARFHETLAETKEICEALAGREVTVEEAQAIIAKAYPEPTPPKKLQTIRNALGSDEAVEVFKTQLDPKMLEALVKTQEKYEADAARAKELRELSFARYEAFEPSNLGGTAWAAYNAVTEVADWREGRNAAESSLWGSRAAEKARAFNAAYELVAA